VSQTTSVLPRGAASIGISVRARYQNGALRPIVPIELPEGAEVEIVIRRDEQS
jgi:predicted DNA-binding antitoxin AbrB/MazE fold protein